MMKLASKYIGVDIGGTHIAVGEVDLSKKIIKPGSRFREEVNALASYDDIMEKWVGVMKRLLDDTNPNEVNIGIAMPGPFDYQQGISYIKDLDKYEALYGCNIKQAFAAELGILPENILFRNDAESFLHAEVLSLEIPESEKVVGVTLGTGLGSAVSCRGNTKDVFRAITPMHDGISEDYISSRWFVKRYFELTGLFLENGVKGLMNSNDNEVREMLFKEFSINLGTFLNSFAADEEASHIVIGGNIAKCWDEFIVVVRENILNQQILISKSKLWEDAAMVGAVSLFDLKIKGVGDFRTC